MGSLLRIGNGGWKGRIDKEEWEAYSGLVKKVGREISNEGWKGRLRRKDL